MTDAYTYYEVGVRALLARLDRDDPRYADALVYQHRMLENLAAARRYGDTETRRAERAEVVDRLNALALAAVGTSFNDFCREETGAPGSAPPDAGPPAGSVTYVHTGGGAYVVGNVSVRNGDFVGRDRTDDGAQPAPPRPGGRPAVPVAGDPPALIAAALRARRLLLVETAVPFPPEARPSGPPALTVSRWQQEADSLPPFPWSIPQLHPVTLLSLDPSDRVEAAFREAGVPLNVLRGRQDVVVRGQHNLIKLGGDLAARHGLLRTWAQVRDVPNDADKAHLLAEAEDVAQDGVVLVVGDAPSDAFGRLWDALIRPSVGGARHCLALGPADARWPEGVRHVAEDVTGVLARLAEVDG
jgi:hypothetical protein